MNPTETTTSFSRPDLRERVASLKLPPPERSSRRSTGLWVLVFLLLATNFATAWVLKNHLDAQPPVDGDATAGGTAATGSGTQSSNQVAASKGTNQKSPASLPTTSDAGANTPAVMLESKGYITPVRQILVSPKVSGMVTQLTFEEGMQVQKGDLLAVIESTEYQAAKDRSQANFELAKHKLLELERGARPDEIAQAQAELAEARVTAEESERDYLRMVDLVKVNASTDQALTLARSQALAAKQRVLRLTHALDLMNEGPRVERIDAARAEVMLMRADLDAAEWRLGNCTIYAPVTGTILKKNAEEGNIVNPVAFNGSFSLCDMADLTDLEVQLDIQERDIRRVVINQVCELRADAFPDRKYTGYVSRLLPIADRAKGAVPVRVKINVPVEEQGAYLKPEMGAIVTFLSRTVDSAPAATPASPTSTVNPVLPAANPSSEEPLVPELTPEAAVPDVPAVESDSSSSVDVSFPESASPE